MTHAILNKSNKISGNIILLHDGRDALTPTHANCLPGQLMKTTIWPSVCYSFFMLPRPYIETRVSCETSFDSKQPKLEPKLVSALSETKR
jgi:hypothetical protein